MSDPDEKILVRSVNWLGDAIMTTPALIRLREARPKAEITLFSPEKLSDLWKNQHCIDKVITYRHPKTSFRQLDSCAFTDLEPQSHSPTQSVRPWNFGSRESPIASAPAVACC